MKSTRTRRRKSLGSCVQQTKAPSERKIIAQGKRSAALGKSSNKVILPLLAKRGGGRGEESNSSACAARFQLAVNRSDEDFQRAKELLDIRIAKVVNLASLGFSIAMHDVVANYYCREDRAAIIREIHAKH